MLLPIAWIIGIVINVATFFINRKDDKARDELIEYQRRLILTQQEHLHSYEQIYATHTKYWDSVADYYNYSRN